MGGLRALLICVVRVVGGGGVIPPLPVPSPWNKLVMVLGTGASFGEGFVSVAEARIIAGTRSGGSCGTNCGELHPLARACRSRTRVGGFLGGAVGGPSPRVCCWSPTDRSEVVGWLDILASTNRIWGLFWALCVHILRRVYIISSRVDDLVVVQGFPLEVLGWVL